MKIQKLLFIFFFFNVLLSQVKMSITTIPGKARVVLDGVVMGNSPISNERVSPGEHKFEIVKEGYAPLKYEFIVSNIR